MHNAALLTENETKAENAESMDDLKAKLENLKAEAASLGISEPASSPVGGGYRGWYRGRGRGARSYYRGGPPSASMNLRSCSLRTQKKSTHKLCGTGTM